MATKIYPEPLIRGNQESPNACVIWLHGLGADASDFAPIVPQLNLPVEHKIKFIFPNACAIPVTVNANYIMPAWYDILELTEERVINEQDLKDSAGYIHSLIQDAIEQGIPSQNIIIIGFSQGGAVAYHAALSYPKRLAGIAALSTYFPKSSLFVAHESNLQQDILICHGTYDAMVVERQGQAARERLTEAGHKTDYKSYKMEHEVCIEEIGDLSSFIQSKLC